jgi:hypothetical protein
MLRAVQEALAVVWSPRPGCRSHITPPPLALSTLLCPEPNDRAATVKGSENAGIVAHDTRRTPLCLVLIHRPGCHHHIIPHPPKVSALLCSSWCRQTEAFLMRRSTSPRRSTSAFPTVGSAVPKPCLTVFAPPRPPSDATLSNHSRHALQRLFVSATGRI